MDSKISIHIEENETYIRNRLKNCDDCIIRPMLLGEEKKIRCLVVYIAVSYTHLDVYKRQVLGVGATAGYLDENGNLPGIDKCFKVDAIATSFGALFGMPSMTTYLESSAGVEAGGKTGLTVIFTSICFGLALFLAPLALIIPSAATSPVLIFIGINMLSGMRNIDYSDITEYIPAFICVTFTIFANNIANGICVALPAYLLMKIAAGKMKKIEPVMYVLVEVCLLYFYTLV